MDEPPLATPIQHAVTHLLGQSVFSALVPIPHLDASHYPLPFIFLLFLPVTLLGSVFWPHSQSPTRHYGLRLTDE